MNKFTVSENVEIVADGKRILLEKGDKIVLENSFYKSTLGKLLGKYNLPTPPSADKFLGIELWQDEYNHTWSTGARAIIDNKDRIIFDDYNYDPVIAINVNNKKWMFVDGQWEEYESRRKYTNKHDNKPMGGSSDLSRHLSANSPHGLSK